MPNVVMFDFFGTLVDYDPSVHPPSVNAPAEYAARAGLELPLEATDLAWQRAWDDLEASAVASGREYSMLQVVCRYWHLLGRPETDPGADERLVKDYGDAWSSPVRPRDGALGCLEELSTDHRVLIVSNTHDPGLVQGLARKLGLLEWVADIVTSVDVGWRKPHPELFAAAVERGGVHAGHAVYVGDNWVADIEGAEAAGLAAIYVGGGVDGRIPTPLQEVPSVVRSSDGIPALSGGGGSCRQLRARHIVNE